MSMKPVTILDPVCGMTVEVATAEAKSLTVELEGRTYAFCRVGCMRAFTADPMSYTSTVAAAEAATLTAASVAGQAVALVPVIDDGMRRWYESCSCCLSEAFPEVKAQLDAERAAAARPPIDPGICEVAEAHQ